MSEIQIHMNKDLVPASPTLTPTEDPFPVSPTLTPTEDPVPASPTLTPTEDPVPASPTLTPTDDPIPASPTLTPTNDPAPASPTLTPTDDPIPASPTLTPTEDPVPASPTLTPTEDPVPVSPTLTPTEDPVPASPTLTPTEEPVPASPTLTPTDDPIPASPTLTPTNDPVPASPTLTPTNDPVPASPTLTPTNDPTPASPNNQTKCALFLGLWVDLEVREAGSRLPLPCWRLLCSEPNPYSFYSMEENITTYWFLDKNSECFEQLNTVGENEEVFSKSVDITLKINLIVLNPNCIQSRGFAYIQTFQNDFSSISPFCRKSLCYSGSTILSYTKLKTIFIGPEHLYDNEFADTCVSDLRIKAQNGSYTSSDEEVYYTSEYPDSSLCPMAVVFKTFPSGTRVVIPFRSSWDGGARSQHLVRDTHLILFVEPN
ncbi:gibberellin-regulated protein 14-like [Penaeus japonicus]|uniref:gibberellin-regulated protein 14-like n=1 Tax=Penaeus japonicus TaxID=27405 RepID=UPI001C7143AD|nr:gibberellin-regulated protein 14-like [Penaeus japonicus]